MAVEFKVREIVPDDYSNVAEVESVIIINEVFDGTLPVCDLGDLGNKKAILTGLVKKNRLEKIISESADDKRKLFLVEDKNGLVLGKGCLRFDEVNSRAILYSFNILKSVRGSMASIYLLKTCFDEIQKYEEVNNVEFKVIRASRYERSELRKPFFTKISKMVNRAQPDSVKVETYEWEGEKVLAFNFPAEIAKDLLDELGKSYVAHFS